MANSRREELGAKLEAILGSPNVYFQPPDELQMSYPAIRFERDDADQKHANNGVYNWKQRYQVTFMAYDPDSDVIDKLMEFPLSKFSRHYATSGLNHDVFVIYH